MVRKLYGCETWMISMENQNKIETFEIQCLRKMLRIRWTDRITNEEVLNKISERRVLWTSLLQVDEMSAEQIGHRVKYCISIITLWDRTLKGKPHRKTTSSSRYLKIQIMKDQPYFCGSYLQLTRKTDKKDEWSEAANQSEY